jgi:hypothetical protein
MIFFYIYQFRLNPIPWKRTGPSTGIADRTGVSPTPRRSPLPSTSPLQSPLACPPPSRRRPGFGHRTAARPALPDHAAAGTRSSGQRAVSRRRETLPREPPPATPSLGYAEPFSSCQVAVGLGVNEVQKESIGHCRSRGFRIERSSAASSWSNSS